MYKRKYICRLLIVTFFLFTCAEAIALSQRAAAPIKALFSDLRGSYAKVDDYSAMMLLESFDGEHQLQKQKVWFKKPGYLLLQQLGPYKKGAELAILPNGSIRGHLGGLLSFAVVSLEKDDSNLYGVTNDYAFNTDFAKIIDIAEAMLPRVKSYELNKSDQEKIILDSILPDKLNKIRLIIDYKSLMIIGLERYQNEKLIHRITWSDIKININIDIKKFNL